MYMIAKIIRTCQCVGEFGANLMVNLAYFHWWIWQTKNFEDRSRYALQPQELAERDNCIEVAARHARDKLKIVTRVVVAQTMALLAYLAACLRIEPRIRRDQPRFRQSASNCSICASRPKNIIASYRRFSAIIPNDFRRAQQEIAPIRLLTNRC